MLEFTEVFPKGHIMSKSKWGGACLEMVMNCKNIDFGHVKWLHLDNSFYNEEKYMIHIVDNIIDFSVHDDNYRLSYTFFEKIVNHSRVPHIIHYMFNNGHINQRSFTPHYSRPLHGRYHVFCKCCPHKHFDKLVNHLTNVSLNKFKGYYNLEKYYDMLNIMLLILKAQHKLPITVIKHLIIPFIYQ